MINYICTVLFFLIGFLIGCLLYFIIMNAITSPKDKKFKKAEYRDKNKKKKKEKVEEPVEETKSLLDVVTEEKTSWVEATHREEDIEDVISLNQTGEDNAYHILKRKQNQ